MSYSAFQTLAFTQYGIPNCILEVVSTWILQQAGDDAHMHHIADDLGYAELARIQTIDAAMHELQHCISQASLGDTPQHSKKLREQFLKDAGGRVGRGFYRYALKAYYLTLPRSAQ